MKSLQSMGRHKVRNVDSLLVKTNSSHAKSRERFSFRFHQQNQKRQLLFTVIAYIEMQHMSLRGSRCVILFGNEYSVLAMIAPTGRSGGRWLLRAHTWVHSHLLQKLAPATDQTIHFGNDLHFKIISSIFHKWGLWYLSRKMAGRIKAMEHSWHSIWHREAPNK